MVAMRWLVLSVVVAATSSLSGARAGGGWIATAGQAAAQPQDWRAEFDDLCSKTQDAMALKRDELRNLVERCDKLKQRIDGLEESQRKVFAKRLRACRDLYQFVLDSLEKA
jgi:hypothetical protein